MRLPLVLGLVLLMSLLRCDAASHDQQAAEPGPSAPEPSVQLPPALDRVLRDYEAAWSARDPRGLAVLFAEDGFVLPGGRPPVRGRAAIQQHYEGSGGPLALRAMAFAEEGRVAWIIGGYSSRQGEADTGKFTLVLRRGPDGRWLIAGDMDSPNARRPPPPQ